MTKYYMKLEAILKNGNEEGLMKYLFILIILILTYCYLNLPSYAIESTIFPISADDGPITELIRWIINLIISIFSWVIRYCSHEIV